MTCAATFQQYCVNVIEGNFWAGKQNFYSLSMLAGQIELYGPVRYCINMICERQIQLVKSNIKVSKK